MKAILKLWVMVFIVILGCENAEPALFHFSNTDESLLIETKKERGSGILSLGISSLNFKDIGSEFPYPIKIPVNIKDVKRAQISTDIRAESKYYIDVVTGEIDEKQIFIVDENNNNNLMDDSVRIVKPIDWSTEDDLIECLYSVSKQQEVVEDKTWLRIGRSFDGAFRGGKSEHLIAEFWIGKDQYQVGIASPYIVDYTYDFAPEIAIFSHNESEKDTLFTRDIIKKGEFLKLKNGYYKFDSISYYGELITLVKEHNFDEIVGAQVGMIAPEFTCVSTSNDTMYSQVLHDKILVVANSCACGGDVESTEAYFEISNEFNDKIHILRLDSKIDTTLAGYHIDMDDEFNKGVYDKYRNAYCSRSCVVIGENGRIIDKFPVVDWRQYLPKLVN
ncbi:hypothetical protein [Neolewinella persica]|uniref:hypothetical protein n=1 Tax=Neolewinella persica TaxID=70998 RepID=UPI00038190F1|nr:hypothetical protein [Neolewinella persica]